MWCGVCVFVCVLCGCVGGYVCVTRSVCGCLRLTPLQVSLPNGAVVKFTVEVVYANLRLTFPAAITAGVPFVATISLSPAPTTLPIGIPVGGKFTTLGPRHLVWLLVCT